MPKLNLMGHEYNWWTVIAPAPNFKPNETAWLCRCRCGTVKAVGTFALRQGNSKHCGCRGNAPRSEAATKHGHSRKPEYRIWRSMKQRCSDARHPAYHNYGGRGIAVSIEWEIFENFLRDMGPRPSKSHSIERVDNDKGYTKENCIWATAEVQNRNRRNNRRIVYKGKTYILADLAVVAGISAQVLARRLDQGWDVSEAVETPLFWNAKFYTYKGKVCTLKELENLSDRVSAETIQSRINSGWSVSAAVETPLYATLRKTEDRTYVLRTDLTDGTREDEIIDNLFASL